MKNITLISCILLLASTNVFGQVFKFRTTDFFYKVKDSKGNFGDWQKDDSTVIGVLTVIDITNSKIDMYGPKKESEYSIVRYVKSEPSGSIILNFTCVDWANRKVSILLMLSKKNADNKEATLLIVGSDNIGKFLLKAVGL